MRISVGLTAGGIIVAAALTILIVLAVQRADEAESLGEDASAMAVEPSGEAIAKDDVRGTGNDRSMNMTRAADDDDGTVTLNNPGRPSERESDPAASSTETESEERVQHLGGVDSVSVMLGALIPAKPQGFGAVEPDSQLSDAPVRALYPPGVSKNEIVSGPGSVLDLVVEFITTKTGVDDAAAIDPGVLADTLPTSLARRGYVLERFHDLIAEFGTIDRVYRVLDGTDGAHLLLRNTDRQWWRVWVYVSAGEIVDVEYRALSDADTAD